MFKYYEKTYNLLQKYLPWCFKACGVLTIYHSTGLSCNSASMITPPGTPCIPSSICHGPSWLFCNRMLWPNNQYWIVYNTKLHRMADNYGRHTAVRRIWNDNLSVYRHSGEHRMAKRASTHRYLGKVIPLCYRRVTFSKYVKIL